MSRSCPGHVQVMFRSCSGRVQVVSRSCLPLVGIRPLLVCCVHQHSDRPHTSPTFSCVLIWICVIGLPGSRNILLPAVPSTWCSENESWTSSDLLTILAAHTPMQNRVRRRWQPSWWNSDCLSACIARNGTFRDHRRTPSAESHARFRSARHAFHHTIRSAQRAFWTNWQKHVSALSVLNPRVAAATVRRTFQPQGEDRHAQQVRWPDCPGGVAQCDSAAHWREHFSSIGVHPGSFDEDFFQCVTNRFSDLCSSQEVGPFCSPFTPSELRRALGVCVDSAVGFDGIPFSLFKVPFPWWQSALLDFFNLILLGCSSRDVETQHRGARLETW